MSSTRQNETIFTPSYRFSPEKYSILNEFLLNQKKSIIATEDLKECCLFENVPEKKLPTYLFYSKTPFYHQYFVVGAVLDKGGLGEVYSFRGVYRISIEGVNSSWHYFPAKYVFKINKPGASQLSMLNEFYATRAFSWLKAKFFEFSNGQSWMRLRYLPGMNLELYIHALGVFQKKKLQHHLNDNEKEFIHYFGDQLQSLTIEKYLLICLSLARQLQKIHKANLIHLDINPSNIRINNWDDSNPQLFIYDFGLSKENDKDQFDPVGNSDPFYQRSNKKNLSGVRGTIPYVPLEVYSKRATFKSDVYCLVFTLAMLSGGHAMYFSPGDSMAFQHATKLEEGDVIEHLFKNFFDLIDESDCENYVVVGGDGKNYYVNKYIYAEIKILFSDGLKLQEKERLSLPELIYGLEKIYLSCLNGKRSISQSVFNQCLEVSKKKHADYKKSKTKASSWISSYQNEVLKYIYQADKDTLFWYIECEDFACLKACADKNSVLDKINFIVESYREAVRDLLILHARASQSSRWREIAKWIQAAFEKISYSQLSLNELNRLSICFRKKCHKIFEQTGFSVNDLGNKKLYEKSILHQAAYFYFAEKFKYENLWGVTLSNSLIQELFSYLLVQQNEKLIIEMLRSKFFESDLKFYSSFEKTCLESLMDHRITTLIEFAEALQNTLSQLSDPSNHSTFFSSGRILKKSVESALKIIEQPLAIINEVTMNQSDHISGNLGKSL